MERRVGLGGRRFFADRYPQEAKPGRVPMQSPRGRPNRRASFVPSHIAAQQALVRLVKRHPGAQQPRKSGPVDLGCSIVLVVS
jgi:hypothetical protein